MTIPLSQEEVQILLNWASNTVQGGHWGDGNLVLGEEQSVIGKLNAYMGEAIEFSPLEMRVIRFWRDSNAAKKSPPLAAGLSLKIDNPV